MPAPEAPGKILSAPLRETSGSWYDTSDRAAIRDLYNNVYAPTNTASMGFTGDVTTCTPGQISEAWRTAVTTRINFLRGMAGVPATISLHAPWSAKNQQSAIMFSRNQALSHTPPGNWTCYTSDGAESAGKSNICLLRGHGQNDPGCVAGYVEDAGANNGAVGHRRWIFVPQTTAMGVGDAAENGIYPRTNALWVIDAATLWSTRPATREAYVAWPPKGYTPYQLVPARWSFSYPNANFANATVTMTKGGSSVSVTYEPIENGYGENTLVWTPNLSRGNPGADTPVQVTVSNVLIDGSPRSFSYEVIIFDPAVGAPSAVSVTIYSNPPGRTVTVDSVNYVAPHTFAWTPGSQHSLSVPSPQAAGSSRYLFANWSNGGSRTQNVSAPSTNAAYTANFLTQHQLTTQVTGSGSVSASPSTTDGFYNPGTTVQLTATPASNFAFSGWSGSLSGPSNPQTIVMDAPKTVTAAFTATSSGNSGLRFTPVAPCRVADTRSGSKIAAGATRTFSIPTSGCPGIPANAKAYSLNFTVVADAPVAYITAWPTGQSRPLASTVNAPGGGVVANAAFVPAGANGAIDVYAENSTHLLIDINGYFAEASPSATLQFFPLTPCRLADTRNAPGTFGGPRLSGGAPRVFPVRSACGIPSTAVAYSFNITALPAEPMAYLTIWPTGSAQPGVSTLNAYQGELAVNAAVTPAGTSGNISVFASHATDLVMDVNGYFAPPASGGLSFYPQTPCRVLDTRSGQPQAANATLAIPMVGTCGVAAGAGAYSLNLTVVPAEPLGYLTAWATGTARPVVSTLNSWTGAIAANAALVPAGSSGGVSAFVTNPTHLIVDINGRFAP